MFRRPAQQQRQLAAQAKQKEVRMSNMDSGPAQALLQIHQVEAQCQGHYDWQYGIAGPQRRVLRGRQLLCRLGVWLVAVGERLEQMAPAQPSYQQNHGREGSQPAQG